RVPSLARITYGALSVTRRSARSTWRCFFTAARSWDSRPAFGLYAAMAKQPMIDSFLKSGLGREAEPLADPPETLRVLRIAPPERGGLQDVADRRHWLPREGPRDHLPRMIRLQTRSGVEPSQLLGGQRHQHAVRAGAGVGDHGGAAADAQRE